VECSATLAAGPVDKKTNSMRLDSAYVPPNRYCDVHLFDYTIRYETCSYRVRGVGGSCAKHLTVESYTVVMLLTFILIIISIPSALTLSFQA